jgi:hypothetical protein
MTSFSAAMSFADKTAELWFQIDQLHLSYLQHDETPPKVIVQFYFLFTSMNRKPARVSRHFMTKEVSVVARHGDLLRAVAGVAGFECVASDNTQLLEAVGGSPPRFRLTYRLSRTQN